MPHVRLQWTVVLAVSAASVFAAATAYTVPRYSARYGQDCNLCHVNPTGGGQRSTYATQFIVPKEMALLSLDEKTLAAIDPQLSPNLSIGTDVRTMFFAANESPGLKGFFQMQGGLYVTLGLTDRIFTHISYGLGSQGYSGAVEIYGFGYVLPANGYIKVGRFVPDFGWRVPDHTSFVRKQMGFVPPFPSDVGVELGMFPGPLAVTASLVNGNIGEVRDNDGNLGVTGRVLYRGTVGGVGLGAGGSLWWNEDPEGKRLAWGPMVYAKVGPLIWIGEADFSELDSLSTGNKGTGFFTSHEVAVLVRQGLEIKGTFDYYDRDQDADTGTRIRYGIGAESMLYPFVRLEALLYLHKNRDENGTEFPEPEYNQFIAQVHFCY